MRHPLTLLLTAMLALPVWAEDRADTVLYNGTVLTMDDADTQAQAIAIKGERILFVGDSQQARAYGGRQIDLAGKTVIPGLNDTHIHAIRAGQGYLREEYWYGVTSLRAGLAQLQRRARQLGAGEWVTVQGAWHPAQFSEKRAPTVADLDEALPDNPAYVQYLYDYGLLNHAGLRALGLDQGKTIEGLTLERDEQGRLTGRVSGSIAAFSRLSAAIAPAASADAQRDSLLAFFRQLNRYGVTSLVDAAGGGSGPAIYAPLFRLHREQTLPLRVAYRVSVQQPGEEAKWFADTLAYLPPRLGDAQLRFLGMGELLVPGMNDGVQMGPGFRAPPAALESLEQVATFAAQRHYPLEIHAYTDDAGQQILDVFERVAQRYPLQDLRWAIAHLNTGTPATFARMKKLGLAYSVQMGPYFEAPALAEANGHAVAEAAPPIRQALDAGVKVVGGTDAARIGQFAIWQALEYDVTGQSAGQAVQRDKALALSRLEALRLYTANAAWLTFEEHEKGTLAPGMLADLAVLDQPYLTMPADQIHRLRATLTMVGGRIVFAE